MTPEEREALRLLINERRRALTAGPEIHPGGEEIGRVALKEAPPGVAPPGHGTESGYRNRGCRCDYCRWAATLARRERRLRSRVPCEQCGTMVDSQDRRDPGKRYECHPCAISRINEIQVAA